jgi:hypothetical protein
MLIRSLNTPEILASYEERKAWELDMEKSLSPFLDELKALEVAMPTGKSHNNIATILSQAMKKGGSVITLRKTKSALNAAIRWSSSKFNHYKKSDVINSIYQAINDDSVTYAIGLEYTTGTFSAGSTGSASSNQNFSTSFNGYSNYQLLTFLGHHYLLCDSTDILTFSNASSQQLHDICLDKDYLNRKEEIVRKLDAAKSEYRAKNPYPS